MARKPTCTSFVRYPGAGVLMLTLSRDPQGSAGGSRPLVPHHQLHSLLWVSCGCPFLPDRDLHEPPLVLLSLGCVNNGLSTVSPIVITSNGTLNVGGVQSFVDIRIGFWGKAGNLLTGAAQD